MLTVRVDTSGLRDRIARIRQRVRNLRPFFAMEGTRILHDEIRRVFETEGYGTWPPLSPGYAARKRSIAPGKPILQLTGAYFRAATSRSAQGSRVSATSRRLSVGIDSSRFADNYPALHEEGEGRLPARPVFELASPRAHTRIADALGGYVFRRQSSGSIQG